MFKGFVALVMLVVVYIGYSYSTAEAGPFGLFGSCRNSSCSSTRAPSSVSVTVTPAPAFVPAPVAAPTAPAVMTNGCNGSASTASSCSGRQRHRLVVRGSTGNMSFVVRQRGSRRSGCSGN